MLFTLALKEVKPLIFDVAKHDMFKRDTSRLEKWFNIKWYKYKE